MQSYHELREKYKTFTYHSYSISESDDSVEISYHFSIDGLAEFAPRWRFPKPVCTKKLTGNATFERLVFNLGLAELVSYWKAACPPEVRILAGALDAEQAAWWKNLYYHGLGEFFYVNHIEAQPGDFMRIISTGESIEGVKRHVSENARCLIPVGGGKDSVVTLEVLKSRKADNFCYIINPRGATLATAEIAGYGSEQILAARRTLDPELLRLNREGFLNGHTPFSAVVAFSALVTAYLWDIQSIALSNESSASESTIPDSSVNHQYSKSFAFERDFVNYEKRWLGSHIQYFSLLRPMTEYHIARLFARCDAYHQAFRSCNSGSKADIWCGNCPKCLFVYLILSPFLSDEQLCSILGKNLLEDKELIPILEKLTGIVPEKPFECVGSRAEVNLAIRKTLEQKRQTGEKLSALLAHYIERSAGLEVMPEKKALALSSEHVLPVEFLRLLTNASAEGYNGSASVTHSR